MGTEPIILTSRSRFGLNGIVYEWLHLAIVFISVFSVFLWSAPRTVVFEDDGIFILAAYYNGIAHPPGYPLFTLLSHLSTLIPIGSVAFRVHALSGLFGALSCVCVWYLVQMLLADRVYAYTAALGFGISKIFWSQSIIAEVYSLNVLLFLILVILSIYLVRDERGKNTGSIMGWMGVLYGLGLSNHWPLILLSTPMLIAIILPRWKVWIPYVPRALLFLIAGLLPYAWMVWRSQMNPPISFYGPLESLSDIWFYISRQGYIEADHNIGANWYDKLKFCGFALKETATQFGYFPTLFIITGIICQWRYLSKNFCIALLLGFLGSTFILALLLGFAYDPLHKNLFKVYPLIAYAVVSIWMVFGVKYIVGILSGVLSNHLDSKFIKTILCISIVIPGFFINLPYNYRASDNLAEEYGLAVLETLDENAIFITFTDVDTGPLGYMSLIQKVRPDVLLINFDGLVFSNRLFRKATINYDQKYEILSEFLKAVERPVYFIQGIPNIYGSNDYGIYLKLDKTFEKNTATAVAHPKLIKLYESLLVIEELADPWELMVQHLIIADYCRIATRGYLDKNHTYNRDELVRICRGYHAHLRMVAILLSDPEPDIAFLRKMLDEARLLKHEALTVEDLASLEYLEGRVFMLENKNEQARQHFRESLAIWPHEKNESERYLNELARPAGGQ